MKYISCVTFLVVKVVYLHCLKDISRVTFVLLPMCSLLYIYIYTLLMNWNSCLCYSWIPVYMLLIFYQIQAALRWFYLFHLLFVMCSDFLLGVVLFLYTHWIHVSFTFAGKFVVLGIILYLIYVFFAKTTTNIFYRE